MKIYPPKKKRENAGRHVTCGFAGAFDVLRDGGVILHDVIVTIGREEVDAQGRFLDAAGYLAKTPRQAAVSIIPQLIAIAIIEIKFDAGQVRFAAGTGAVISAVTADEILLVYVQITIVIPVRGNWISTNKRETETVFVGDDQGGHVFTNIRVRVVGNIVSVQVVNEEGSRRNLVCSRDIHKGAGHRGGGIQQANQRLDSEAHLCQRRLCRLAIVHRGGGIVAHGAADGQIHQRKRHLGLGVVSQRDCGHHGYECEFGQLHICSLLLAGFHLFECFTP